MPFAEKLKLEIRRKAHFKCCLCHSLGVEIHHIIPEAEKGPDTEDNAAPLCPTCHDIYGDNPKKRKFIKEARDLWYELCEHRFAQGTGLLSRFEAMDNRAKGPQAPRIDNVDSLTVLDFDGARDQTAEFSGVLSPAYRESGVIIKIHFSMSSATVGIVRWTVSMSRNLVGDRKRAFTTSKAITQAVPGKHRDDTVGELRFHNGEEMDNISAGDPFLLKLVREALHPDDTAPGDAEFIAVEIFEATSLL